MKKQREERYTNDKETYTYTDTLPFGLHAGSADPIRL